MALREYQEPRGFRALEDRKVQPELKELQELKELLELKEQLALVHRA
jgi:hypothetical protein